jgi:hypothetical protein
MSPSATLCEICLRVAIITCPQCDNSRYCSHRCLKLGHKYHQLLCRSFKHLNNTNRPSPLHRRAIYLAVDEAHPRFIWLPFTRSYEMEIGDTYDMPVRGDLLGPHSFMDLIPIRRNKVLNRKLQDTVSVMVRDAGLIDGSALNRSVLSVLNGSPGVQFQWAGPMIVYGEKGTALDPNESRDLDMVDFRHLIDELSSRTDQSACGEETHVPLGAYALREIVCDAMADLPKSKVAKENSDEEKTSNKTAMQQPKLETVADVRSTEESQPVWFSKEEGITFFKTLGTWAYYCVLGMLAFQSARYVLPVLLVVARVSLRVLWWFIRKALFILIIKAL